MPDEPIWPTLPGGGGSGLGSRWVDLCSAPYSATPGADITSALQAAINAANTANQDTTIYFSVPGNYPVTGALQSGTDGNAYTYNGQILFPARTDAQGALSIRIMGLTPAAIMWNGINTDSLTGGVVLQTNATAGYMFDCLTGSTTFYKHTNLKVTFENITLRAPTNPQCGLVNGIALACLRMAGVWSVDVVDVTGGASVPTGTLAALVFPPYDNAGVSMADGVGQFIGQAIAVQHSEHFVLNNALVQSCAVGMQPLTTTGVAPPHAAQYRRMLVQGTPTAIKPSISSFFAIEGALDVGDSTGTFGLVNVVDDINNRLVGTLRVFCYGQTAAGFQINGARSLTFIPYGNGRPSQWPSDKFQRIKNIAGTALGTTSETNHQWDTASPFTTTNGTGLVAGTGTAVVKYSAGRAGCSRIVRVVARTGLTTYSIYQIVNKVNSGANANNYLWVRTNGGLVQLGKNIGGTNTTLAQSAAAAVAANTNYTIDVVITNPVNGAFTINVLVNGVAILSTVVSGTGTIAAGVYTLAAAEVAQFTDTDLDHTQDGISLFGDPASPNNSVVSYWAVMPN